MNAGVDMLISPLELAGRWGKTETAIRLASAVGVGPRFIKTGGQIMYPMEEVQKFESPMRWRGYTQNKTPT